MCHPPSLPLAPRQVKNMPARLEYPVITKTKLRPDFSRGVTSTGSNQMYDSLGVWKRGCVRGRNLNWHFGTRRRLSALACLLGMAFFYTQVAAVTLVMGSGVCCGGDHCPISEHHHSAAKSENASGDCGHAMQHDMGHMAACSLSCCQTTSEIAFHSHFYLSAATFVVSHIAPASSAVSTPVSRMPFLSVAPAVPPPKSFSSIA